MRDATQAVWAMIMVTIYIMCIVALMSGCAVAEKAVTEVYKGQKALQKEEIRAEYKLFVQPILTSFELLNYQFRGVQLKVGRLDGDVTIVQGLLKNLSKQINDYILHKNEKFARLKKEQRRNDRRLTLLEGVVYGKNKTVVQ